MSEAEPEGLFDHIRDASDEHIRDRLIAAEELSGKLLADAIKTMFLINGGALVALLAFFGAISQGGRPIPEDVDGLVRNFVAGLACAGLASIMAWMSMDSMAGAYIAKLQGKSVNTAATLGVVSLLVLLPALTASLIFAWLGFSGAADVIKAYSEQPLG